jgi:hypothetical protein
MPDRKSTEVDVEKLRAEIGKILDVGDDLLGRLPFIRRQLVALANLPRDLQEAKDRAERAEAESARREEILNEVVRLVEYREQRYINSGRTAVKAVPVADLRRALGMRK